MKQLFGGSMMSPVPDPYAVYLRLRREAPVTLVDMVFSEAYLVTRYDDVLMILKDAARFSSRVHAKGIGLVLGKTILAGQPRRCSAVPPTVTTTRATRASSRPKPAGLALL